MRKRAKFIYLISPNKISSNFYRELKEVLKDENSSAETIKSKLDSLNTAAMKLGEIMYKENQSNTGENVKTKADKSDENKTDSNKDNAGKKQEDVVDADFEEVKEDKEKKSS